jgi:7,8-dihydropterin-6-yl-methyl-4-(beta-D-ribofuranosyl)aminobenzene 5'-phosphate synthase
LGFFNKFIGMRKDLLREYKHRFDDISTATEVLEDVFILHTDEETYPEPRGNRRLLDKKNGTFKPDDFDHEVILVITESDGLTVFTGCSHKGILNMIDTVGKRFPGRPIKAVFGGFHLVDLPIIQNLAESRPEIEAIGAQMLDRVAGRVYTGTAQARKHIQSWKGSWENGWVISLPGSALKFNRV